MNIIILHPQKKNTKIAYFIYKELKGVYLTAHYAKK